MNKFILLTIIIFYSFTSCHVNNSLDDIKIIYQKSKPNGNFLKYRKIIIINENANCVSCNQKFANEMEEYINRDSTLFIISGNGSKVDLSFYLDRSQENIIFDEMSEFKKLNFPQASLIIDIDKKMNISKVKIIDMKRYLVAKDKYPGL